MLHNISWTSYATAMGWTIAIYYTAIAVVYYRTDIIVKAKALLSSKRANPLQDAIARSNPDLYPVAHVLRDKLKMRFSKLDKQDKNEWLQVAQTCFKEFPQLKGTPFQVAINNFILQESKILSLALSEDELNMLWNG